jgi:hypothetical protein
MEPSVSIYFERMKDSQGVVVESLEREFGRLSRGDLTAQIDVAYAGIRHDKRQFQRGL